VSLINKEVSRFGNEGNKSSAVKNFGSGVKILTQICKGGPTHCHLPIRPTPEIILPMVSRNEVNFLF
jgi:hypothetical protein